MTNWLTKQKTNLVWLGITILLGLGLGIDIGYETTVYGPKIMNPEYIQGIVFTAVVLAALIRFLMADPHDRFLWVGVPLVFVILIIELCLPGLATLYILIFNQSLPIPIPPGTT